MGGYAKLENIAKKTIELYFCQLTPITPSKNFTTVNTKININFLY